MPPALLGLYHPQLHKGGKLAFAGYTMAGLGATLSVIAAWWGLVPGTPDPGPAGLAAPAGNYLFAIGVVLFAAATLRAGLLSKWGAGLLLAGAGVGLLTGGWLPLPAQAGTAGVLIGSAGLGWLGISLLLFKG
jgi:hypothetical protein